MPVARDSVDAVTEESESETTPLGSADSRFDTSDRGSSDPSLEPLRQRYDVLAELGRGGMGIVYRARDRETGDLVAVKVLRPEIAANAEVLERFRNELLLARRITHPNVCRTHELLRFGPLVAITMEYVEGRSLRTILETAGGIGITRGLDWARQICSGLAEAHARGVVHRDLKPENIVVDRRGVVKLMDFGIARSLDRATQTGLVIGTPAYMAPEQAEGKPADQRSDVYALGLILYELFSGRQAFRGETPVALAHQQVHGKAETPRTFEPYLPLFVEKAITKCLEKDPAKRFQRVDELAQRLVPGEEARSAVRAEAALPRHLTSFGRRDVLVFLGGAIGLVLFVLLAGYMSPESDVRVALTREQFLEKARAEMVSRDWQPASAAWVEVTDDAATYRFLAERARRGEGSAPSVQEFPPFLYSVTFGGTQPGEKEGPRVVYAPNGTLREVRLPVEPWIPPGTSSSKPFAATLAEHEVGQRFGIDVASLTAESELPLETQGRRGYLFGWVQRLPRGVEWHYKAEVYDRVAYLGRWTTVPQPTAARTDSKLPTIVGLAWFAVIVLIFTVRRLFLEAQPREIGVLGGVALCLISGFALAWQMPDLGFLWWAALYAIALALWLFIASRTTVFLARRPWPHLVSSYAALLELKPAMPASAIAAARGCALGVLLLGAQATLLAGAVHARWIAPRAALPGVLNSRMPLFSIATVAAFVAIFLVYGLASSASLVRRWSSSALLLGMIGSGTLLVNTPLSLPVDWVRLAITAAVGAAFCWVLVAHDMLTALCAAGTFRFWLECYPLARMHENVGNGEYWLGLALWGALFGWAVFAVSRAWWRRVSQRTAEVLE